VFWERLHLTNSVDQVWGNQNLRQQDGAWKLWENSDYSTGKKTAEEIEGEYERQRLLKLHIDQYVENNRSVAIRLLQDLLKFKTVVGTPYREIQEYIGRRLQALGLEIDLWEPQLSDYGDLPWFDAPSHYYPDGFRDKPVLVGTWKGPGGKSIILDGHVDVVSPDPISMWSCDPWEGVVRQGNIYGRGVIDTKGGLAAAIMALDGLKKNHFTPAGRIHFISAIDQEINGAGTIAAMNEDMMQM
jgi:acetylornithine deacetylase